MLDTAGKVMNKIGTVLGFLPSQSTFQGRRHNKITIK